MNSSNDVLLKCENLVVTYSNRRILDDVSLIVKKGERIALLGPSGCGKSTLLNVLAGLHPASGGQLERSLLPGDMAFVFQEPSLLPWKTVEENVCVLPALMSVRGKSAPPVERVEKILSNVGLWERRAAYPDELSGGMKMRVAIARALLMSPALLFLDEPFSALDDITRERLQDDLLKIHSVNGLSYIIVTHNIEEAAILSDKIYLLSSEGRIISELLSSDFFDGKSVKRDSPGLMALKAKVREAMLLTHVGRDNA